MLMRKLLASGDVRLEKATRDVIYEEDGDPLSARAYANALLAEGVAGWYAKQAALTFAPTSVDPGSDWSTESEDVEEPPC